MKDMLSRIKPGGRLLIALAIPYSPFIDSGAS